MRLRLVWQRFARRIGWESDQPARPSTNAMFQSMLRQAAQTREVEYDCEQVYRLLDEFAEAVARGEDVARLMPLVKQHLEMCPDCREEFEALLRVVRAGMSAV